MFFDEKKIEKESKKRKGAWVMWSQDSKKFALVRYDSRKVKSLWVINVLANPRPELETYKYTMPGEKEKEQQELWVFNMADTTRKQFDVKAFNDQGISIAREIKTNKENIVNKYKLENKITNQTRWSEKQRITADYDDFEEGKMTISLVEIIENKCEGMIRLETLNGKWTANVDKYFASNELGEQIRLGDPIKIVVASVDLEKRQINFTRF